MRYSESSEDGPGAELSLLTTGGLIGVRPGLTHEWESFRVFDGINGKIHVQVRPIEMPWPSKFNVHDCTDGGSAEPRELLEGHE